jgi:hypothetical protein
MKIKPIGPSETLVTVYRAARRHIPEDSDLHGYHKPHKEIQNHHVSAAGVKSVDLAIGTYSFGYQICYIRYHQGDGARRMKLVEHAAQWKL